MKKLIITILCVISVSCITLKNTNTNRHKLGYRIGNVKISCIDRNKLKEVLIKMDGQIIHGVPSDSSLTLYVSPDYKIFASKKIKNITLDYPFSQRYAESKGFYGAADFRNRYLSSDSTSIGQDWIFAIEYTDIDPRYSKIIRIHIESNKGRMGITTDIEHRATAIGLMDAFTKELMNVKLKLKANLK